MELDLVSVGGSITPQQFISSLATNGLLSIWGYDSVARAWQTYTPTNTPNTLTSRAPGRGYWVKVSKANTLTLVGSVWPGPTSLMPGCNLVGFLGLTFDPTEQLDLTSTFRDQLSTIRSSLVPQLHLPAPSASILIPNEMSGCFSFYADWLR